MSNDSAEDYGKDKGGDNKSPRSESPKSGAVAAGKSVNQSGAPKPKR